MNEIPPELAPGGGEGAILSLLAVEAEGNKLIRAGSLVVVPSKAAEGSWKEWGEAQPATRPHMVRNEPDLGPSFSEEPFPGVHIHRSIIRSTNWTRMLGELESRRLDVEGGPYLLSDADWSATRLFTQDGKSDAHQVLCEVKRPVRGVALRTNVPEMPSTESLWVRGAKPGKPFGQRTREELVDTETFASWPIHLLGIYWPGTTDVSPPSSFVVGRALSQAWIADVVPVQDDDLLTISIAWDADQIDPVSCALLVRSEIDEAPLLARYWRISDLPGEVAHADGIEARDLPWEKRTIDVRVPRGPRGTDWGVSLISPSGQLLDEQPVARRIERMKLSMAIGDADEPEVESIIGDSRSRPSEAERDAAVASAEKLEVETAARAAGRRISTAGELEGYLKWRFSARAGELLVLDPYLLAGDPDVVKRVFLFLNGLHRPIRALTAKAPESGLAVFRKEGPPRIAVRGLPNGTDTLHDRPWLVGETGVLMGASLNHFLRKESAASTAVDLPFADAAAWRERFEYWWSVGPKFSTHDPLASSPAP
jgi:hypothetical protein